VSPAWRLIGNVGIDPFTDCWHFLGYVAATGYGVTWDGKQKVLAHRFSYELFHGPIPPKHDVDHLCRVRDCCNPDHLEAVTHRENVRRGLAGATTKARMLAKTHCARGHEWTPENTRVTSRQRKCKACEREYRLARAAS
jgi:hypothetical protein